MISCLRFYAITLDLRRRVADWLLRPLRLAVYRVTDVAALQAEVHGALRYIEKSGHLTRGFHAGKVLRVRMRRVQRLTDTIRRAAIVRLPRAYG